MRIFLTGATGYIGSAVLDATLRAGHGVTALVRDPEKAEHVTSRGGHPIVGELSKPAAYVAAAEECDVIIHAAYERSKHGVEVDRRAIETLLGAARRRVEGGRPASVVYTSGVWVLGDTNGPAAEDAPLNPTPLVAWRPAHEALVESLARDGRIRAAIVRPGIVYGGARGIVSDLLKDAKNGLIRVIGDGKNHWPCVYDRDLADLYARLAVHPDASGVFHATDEADERVMTSESIARHAVQQDVDTCRSKRPGQDGTDADDRTDQIVRSPRARALGWAPTLPRGWERARLLEEFRSARKQPRKRTPTSDHRTRVFRFSCRFRIAEFPTICGDTWQEFEEGVEAPVECSAELRNRAVDRCSVRPPFHCRPASIARLPDEQPSGPAGCRRQACIEP
jgi:nucleoside-diphosphate-sugar epimerase